MRIIAGEWRGCPIAAPEGKATRPTADRVREALFSMLASRLGTFEGLRVADLFAGSGALGLEALSRGAAHCTFVEQDRATMAVLAGNAAKLGAGARADLRTQAVETLGVPAQPYDLVLMDPPYESGLAAPALARLAQAGWLAPGGWVSVETDGRDLPIPEGLAAETDRRFGKAAILLLRRAVGER